MKYRGDWGGALINWLFPQKQTYAFEKWVFLTRNVCVNDIERPLKHYPKHLFSVFRLLARHD